MSSHPSPEYRKQWRLKNPDKVRIYRNRYRRTPKGIAQGIRARIRRKEQGRDRVTTPEYDTLLLKQNNVCAICGNENIAGKRLFIDHCHQTNKVRGLLCLHCNTGLGYFKDSSELLSSAIRYLTV